MVTIILKFRKMTTYQVENYKAEFIKYVYIACINILSKKNDLYRLTKHIKFN